MSHFEHKTSGYKEFEMKKGYMRGKREGAHPAVSTDTATSHPAGSAAAAGEALKAAAASLDSSTSVNMPSSLAVKGAPHSAFSRATIPFSASSEPLLPISSRLAKSFL